LSKAYAIENSTKREDISVGFRAVKH